MCTLKKIDFGVVIANQVRRETKDGNALHVIHFLEEGAQFKFIKESHVKAFWKAQGFVVSRTSRKQAKISGYEGGMGMLTEAIHLNLMPLDGTLQDRDWPATAKVQVKTHSKNEGPTTFHVRYAMASHPAFDETLFCTRRCHAVKPCECDRGKRLKAADVRAKVSS